LLAQDRRADPAAGCPVGRAAARGTTRGQAPALGTGDSAGVASVRRASGTPRTPAPKHEPNHSKATSCRLVCHALTGMHPALTPLSKSLLVNGNHDPIATSTADDLKRRSHLLAAHRHVCRRTGATKRKPSRWCARSATSRGEATRVGPPGGVPRRSNRSEPSPWPFVHPSRSRRSAHGGRQLWTTRWQPRRLSTPRLNLVVDDGIRAGLQTRPCGERVGDRADQCRVSCGATV